MIRTNHTTQSLVCCTVLLGTGGLAFGSDVPITLDDLVAGVEGAREGLASFQVEYVYQVDDVDAPNQGHLWASNHYVVALDDGKFLRTRLSSDPDRADVFTIIAFDGEHSGRYHQGTQVAMINDESGLEWLDTEASGFFDLMRWYPCREIRTGSPYHLDLLGLLNGNAWNGAGSPQLRSETEEINGHETYVVDLYPLFADEPTYTIWIDAERGFLPILQKYYSPHTGNLMTIREIHQAHEIAEGIWIPVEGTITFTGGSTEPDVFFSKRTVTVQSSPDSGYSASISPEFEAGYFDITTHLPPGTHAFDLTTDEGWVVQGN